MHINWYTIITVALGVFYSGFAGTETQQARFLGLCLACLKSCDQQWNHTVEQFCPSSSLSPRQWCSHLWLSVPPCGLGNQAEQYMNFNKYAPLSMHSPTWLSQFCFWMEQLMCMGCVKPWAARIWVWFSSADTVLVDRHVGQSQIQFFRYEVPGASLYR